MRKLVLDVAEDGRIVVPPGKRLRLVGEVLDSDELAETDEERARRMEALFEEIDGRLDPLPRKPWPKDDPIVEKYRRMGILEED